MNGIRITPLQAKKIAHLVKLAGLPENHIGVSLSQGTTTSVWVSIDLGDGDLITRIAPDGRIEQQRTYWKQRDEHPDNCISGSSIFNSTNEAHARNLVAEANRST